MQIVKLNKRLIAQLIAVLSALFLVYHYKEHYDDYYLEKHDYARNLLGDNGIEFWKGIIEEFGRQGRDNEADEMQHELHASGGDQKDGEKGDVEDGEKAPKGEKEERQEGDYEDGEKASKEQEKDALECAVSRMVVNHGAKAIIIQSFKAEKGDELPTAIITGIDEAGEYHHEALRYYVPEGRIFCVMKDGELREFVGDLSSCDEKETDPVDDPLSCDGMKDDKEKKEEKEDKKKENEMEEIVEEKAHICYGTACNHCALSEDVWTMIRSHNAQSIRIKTNDEQSIVIIVVDAMGSKHVRIHVRGIKKKELKSVSTEILEPEFTCIDENESSITFEETKLHFFKDNVKSADAMVFSRCDHGDAFVSFYKYERERSIWTWKHQRTIQEKMVKSFQALETHVEAGGKWEKVGKQKIFVKKRKWTGTSGDEETRSRQKLQGLIQRKKEEGAEGKCKLMIENDD